MKHSSIDTNIQEFNPPLAIYFVWHPADEENVKPWMEYCADLLSRHVDRPFSRGMNLPVFFITSYSIDIPPAITSKAQRNIIFPIISKEVAANNQWKKYYESLPSDKSGRFVYVPIAVDKYGISLRGVLDKKNCLRADKWQRNEKNDEAFIAIAHEIYRYTVNYNLTKGILEKNSSIKLFLSHAKYGDTGTFVAKAIKHFIDYSPMQSFFDSYEIMPGQKFDDSIIQEIKESTIIAIHTDAYSSRYWCQRELMVAKEHDRPIIAVDCQEDFEDRRFPIASNVPGVHIHPNKEKISDRDILRILRASILETIRYQYSKILLYLESTEFLSFVPANLNGLAV